ncbi:serine/threonine protein kinase [Prauserella marina]|uniref:non-specific serine/threonine protein kinase n=1 Tax=Prauserella marina TaxID=530584 RepID=A0A222VIU3_9PSEU|nr:Stk1 family PASTA domain-containing Ser/Thr kinase [Prauserella marina]ASR33673.1 serine/threonine protein kinase [Prauserella marina]PWV82221.1 serine/threonine-protein kinase [Prauserella marina]SDD21942.1 serine/threonine protein kinase [Prauserella marina]
MSAPRLLSNRYELGETLGYGGMSEVHHGHDVRLGREVAVKILRADLARDPQFQERFRREAQNAAALNHPAIVAVYDTGEADTEYGPLPYIVMEYVEGRTLRDIVKTEGPMPQKRAMEVMADVCAALDFSHRHGIVHRDVKPANIMITRNGAVKVMDFGIARAVHDGQAAMTQTAAVIGTAQYLSPEQARGEQVDARSDVYAAGCVLYELVTGEPPFTGDSPVAVAYQHVREDPKPPSSVNPAVSAALDAVVLKALAKGAANRYQSSAEMRSDLVRTLSGQRPSAPMVMSEDERTQVMDSGRQQSNDYDYDDYDPDAYDAEEEARRKRKKRTLLAVLLAVLAVAAIGLILWLTNAFSSQPELTPIPDVRGQTVEQAKNTLRSHGFTNFGDQENVVCGDQPNGKPPQCSPDDIGKVIGTTPQTSERVALDQQIKLRVGVGPNKVQVPDLTGMDRAAAEEELKKLNLVLDQNVEEVSVDDENSVGKVVKQSPGPNTEIEEGKSVSITIGTAPETIDVVNYTGETYETAKAKLEQAGFKVNRKDIASDQDEGIVVNQTPNAGSFKAGTEIELQVSNGANQQIQMPDLRGMTQDQALAELRNRGWEGQVSTQTEEVRDSDDVGKVTNTDPSSGSTITKDQSITLYIGEEDGSTEVPSSESRPTLPGFP